MQPTQNTFIWIARSLHALVRRMARGQIWGPPQSYHPSSLRQCLPFHVRPLTALSRPRQLHFLIGRSSPLSVAEDPNRGGEPGNDWQLLSFVGVFRGDLVSD